MIEFVVDIENYKKYKSRFSELFDTQKEFEENPFKENFKYFLSFDFDYIFDEIFFSLLINFFKSINELNILFYTTNPIPDEYYNYFKRYNIFEFDIGNTFSEFEDIIYQGPNDETINSIGISVNDFALFSFKSDDWGILGSRELELGIVGFSNLEMKNNFLDIFANEDFILSLKDNISILNDIINFNERQNIIYRCIMDNFRDKG